MKKYFLYCFMLAFSTSLFAQSLKCDSQERMNSYYSAHPQKNTFKAQTDHSVPTKNAVVTIPVVFHILHQYGHENITDYQLMDAMVILNEHFQKLNNDTINVIPEFQPLMGDAKIEFKLAAIDPNGECTNGIEHIYTHEANLTDDNSKLNQWPPDRYLNIWVT